MKRVLLTALTLAFLTASVQSTAQDVKTKEKSATGAKTKAKADAKETKVKTETADGKETKITTEQNKVVIKGEGVGNQMDTAAARAVMSGGSINLDAARQEIASSNQLWGQALVQGDSASIVGLYHTEARIYPPNAAMMGSRNDVGRMATGMKGSGLQNATLTTTDVVAGGDLVIETGTYEMRNATQVVDRGKYMVVWKQDNGRWRIYRDIWNSDMPAGQR
jgi:ketosteroid isomerase-like protein